MLLLEGEKPVPAMMALGGVELLLLQWQPSVENVTVAFH